MGELTPADWTAELERNGRVVFPLRRQLVTQWPTVVVDTEGIRTGHRLMPWIGMGTAGIPTGTPVLRMLPILPATEQGRYADHG